MAVLSHLHENGVVYVDLKPENVLLQDCGHIMLCDMDLVHTQAEIEHVQELESGAAVVLRACHLGTWPALAGRHADTCTLTPDW